MTAPILHLDLFSGLGCFARAGRARGWRTIAFAETAPELGRVLCRDFPGVPNLGDVRKLCRRVYDCGPEDEEGNVECPRCGTEFGECIGTDQFTDEYGTPDVITGGFPCVDITAAKNAIETPKGIIDDETQSGLWSEFGRIIDELRPRCAIVENSAALSLRGLGRVLGDFAAMRYDAVWFTLAASRLGAPHRRRRCFILAHADEPGLEGAKCAELARALEGRQYADARRSARWGAVPGICRVDDGTARRRERLRALGNALVMPAADFIVEAADVYLLGCMTSP